MFKKDDYACLERFVVKIVDEVQDDRFRIRVIGRLTYDGDIEFINYPYNSTMWKGRLSHISEELSAKLKYCE